MNKKNKSTLITHWAREIQQLLKIGFFIINILLELRNQILFYS